MQLPAFFVRKAQQRADALFPSRLCSRLACRTMIKSLQGELRRGAIRRSAASFRDTGETPMLPSARRHVAPKARRGVFPFSKEGVWGTGPPGDTKDLLASGAVAKLHTEA